MAHKEGKACPAKRSKPVQLYAPQVAADARRRVFSTSRGLDVEVIEGFGEPWVVKTRASLTWNKLEGGENVGLIRGGRIVGARGYALSDGGPRILLTTATIDDADATVWVVQAIRTDSKVVAKGTFLERVDPPADLEGCEVAPRIKALYLRVIELCHQRIWEDNLAALWDGNRERIPRKDFIHAKLFRPGAAVLTATDSDEELVGGAVVRCLRVPSQTPMGRSTSHVVYVDCIATLPGFKAGGALLEQIVRLPGVLVALHSVPLQATLDFWVHFGMRRVDPSSKDDAKWLSGALMSKSGGLVNIELDELASALPQSHLPLFLLCLTSRGSGGSECAFLQEWKPLEEIDKEETDEEEEEG